MHYEKKRFPEFTYEEKEDHGLFLLMQQANRTRLWKEMRLWIY